MSNFLSRWSLRKRKVQQGEEVSDEKVIDFTESVDHSEDIALINTHTELSTDTSSTETVEALEESVELPTEEDLVSINGTSNVSQFMATGVDKNLKKAALRKMFLNPEFAMEDEPNYSTPPKLDPEIAAKLRDWMVEPVEEEEDVEASELLAEQAVENVEETNPINGNDNEYQCVNEDEAQESETKKTI
ncbi:DUF3306 domain-containing protein [Aliivibrio salmonicida]|uniref:DUF3306 domain-containing protein n=1 Tax=Aliivibrio salmonicida TaxID=40269 RepID=UPI00406D2749